MKKIYNILICCGIALASLSCSSKRTVSDDELAQIFHDAFLANAYTLNEGIKLDSLRLYEPIFQRYGYTTEDVQYTIGTFALRKSSRLSDVVEKAITMLEEQGNVYDEEIAVLDTIDNISVRRMTQLIRQDSLLKLNNLKDTVDMRIVIDDPKPGKYNVRFSYLVDESDNTRDNYRVQSWLLNKGDTTRVSPSSALMMRKSNGTYNRSINTTDQTQKVVVQLVGVQEVYRPRESKYKSKANIDVTIRDLVVEYIPDVELAREQLFHQMLDLKVFDDEILLTPKDSL